jgi:membrane-bound lytic murein transglycosylase A
MVHHTIPTKIAKAPKASSTTHTMLDSLRFVFEPLLLCAALSACSTGSKPAPPDNLTQLPLEREQSRWVKADWRDLKGWEQDPITQWWPAFLQGCSQPTLDWLPLCEQAKTAPSFDDTQLRAWLQQRVQPWRVEAFNGDTQGLLTSYVEPTVAASRMANATYATPLYGPPADLKRHSPYFTRQQIDTEPAAKAALQGKALAYVADPLDALMVQIQGSARLQITETNGSTKTVRLAFAGHNQHPYQSVGRWLIEKGELNKNQASWPDIKNWAQKNPNRLNELLWSNPRFVFFREEPITDPNQGPKGAQGLPLTPGRSIAVDPRSMPYGAPVWLDSNETGNPTQSLQKLVMAQDTGSAIVGAVRADYFAGWGPAAEQQAGRMKQVLRLWVLWPK